MRACIASLTRTNILARLLDEIKIMFYEKSGKYIRAATV